MQLTFRAFIPTGGAEVGVIVTDGVIVRFDPVRDIPIFELRCDDPPGVNVAPPGNDDLGGGKTFADRPGVGCPLHLKKK